MKRVLVVFLVILMSLQVYAANDIEDVWKDVEKVDMIVNNDHCQLKAYFREGSSCVTLSPGFWKSRVCADGPQSLSDQTVTELLATIRSTSTYYSNLDSRSDACSILSSNNWKLNRAKKMFLTNLFNYAMGYIKLSEPVNSQYSSATDLQGYV